MNRFVRLLIGEWGVVKWCDRFGMAQGRSSRSRALSNPQQWPFSHGSAPKGFDKHVVRLFIRTVIEEIKVINVAIYRGIFTFLSNVFRLKGFNYQGCVSNTIDYQ